MELEIKHKVLADLQAACPANAIIGSSTSGFKPSELQQGAARPGQIMVCHPFNPVYLMPLIEVVPSPDTDPALVEKADGIDPTYVSIDRGETWSVMVSQ